MEQSIRLVKRSLQALGASVALTAATGEACERYDAGRHRLYAAQRLRERRQLLQEDAASTTDSTAPWLQREQPKFPYLLSLSPADNPTHATTVVLGAMDAVIGSTTEATASSIESLLQPESVLDGGIQQLGSWWRSLKRRLDDGVPTAFDPQRAAIQRRLDDLLAALEASEETPSDSAPSNALVFYLRDFDSWDDTVKTQWLEWIHHVTNRGLAHVVLPTTTAITPSAIAAWQRLHKVPDVDLVAILLRYSSDGSTQSTAIEKLTVLSQQLGLELRGSVDLDTDDDQDTLLPTEMSVIVERVGNWWSDLAFVCERLTERGIQSIDSDEERLAAVLAVCDELEHSASSEVLEMLQLYSGDDSESHDVRLSALQAWKCLQVATGVGDSETMLGSVQQLLLPDSNGGRPANCVHPVDALLPFNQRTHGEDKFMEMINSRLLHLRPKAGLEIGIIPCDAKALVAPCWVEVRPLIKRVFEKLWRDDGHYRRVLQLERFEDNHKMAEEIALFASEINSQQQQFDTKTREFIFMQKLMKPSEVAQRKAELALLELEIESKKVYLGKLQALLD